ncbi:hypothetical protein IWW42_003407 [Coemansia sp. RSA 1085]|nr:hypothetical protein IWW42_003407 [Coemansia sp. RSA 1085]
MPLNYGRRKKRRRLIPTSSRSTISTDPNDLTYSPSHDGPASASSQPTEELATRQMQTLSMQNTQVVVEVQSSSDVEKHSVATLELGSANSDVYRDQSASPQDLQQSPEDMMRTPPPNSRSRLQKQHNLSPSKVYGNRIEVNGDFGTVARGNGVVLDKSLLCKALFDAGRTAICVCLPRRFGKTFNLSVLEEFFNIPHGEDAAAVNGIIDIEVARCSRLKLFEGSLLMENHPEFFEENFCKFPVIRISMKLGDLSSGANNINALPLTVMEERKRVIEETNGAKLKYFGELFAFTKPEVEALVSSVHQKYAATRLYSTTAIVAKAVEWYDGYCFGYLTIKPGGHIAIPNGEMCRMWERLFQLSSNGECDPEQRKDQLGQLHSELYAGKIESLLTEIREIMDPMPNSINGHDEHAYGNIFRTFLFMKFRHYDGGGSEQHVRFLSELETGIGKTDLIVTFPTTQEHSDELTIIIEFKKIYKNEFTSTDYPLKRAIDGLEQIIEKGYARTQRRPWKKSKRRLDIGIAMGCGKLQALTAYLYSANAAFKGV